jgi:hypothetical protein
VTRQVLVIGTGPWANVVSKRIMDLGSWRVVQVPARDFLENRISKDHFFDIGICATRPEFQALVAPKIAQICRALWLEKPIAANTTDGLKLIEELNSLTGLYYLVNYSWTFSNVWSSFKGMGLPFHLADKVSVTRSALSPVHDYMETFDDYGSHDVALMLDWKMKEGEVDSMNIAFASPSEFQGKIAEVAFEWSIDTIASQKRMIWRIDWKDQNSTVLDFYGNRIIHKDKPMDVNRSPDNIESLIHVLGERNSEIARTNHLISLQTNNFLGRLAEWRQHL